MDLDIKKLVTDAQELMASEQLQGLPPAMVYRVSQSITLPTGEIYYLVLSLVNENDRIIRNWKED